MNDTELEKAVRDGLVDAFGLMNDAQRQQTLEKLQEYQAERDVFFEIIITMNPANAAMLRTKYPEAFVQHSSISDFSDMPEWVTYMQTMEVLKSEMIRLLAGPKYSMLEKIYPLYFRPLHQFSSSELRELTIQEGIRVAKEMKHELSDITTPDAQNLSRLDAARLRIKQRRIRG